MALSIQNTSNDNPFRHCSLWAQGGCGRTLAVLTTMLLLAVSPGDTAAQGVVGKADTSRSTRIAATNDIPFSSLTPEAQGKIRAVVDKPSMFRRMPVNVIDCDPDLYRFLIRQPEVVVNIWQLMGITQVTAARTGPFTLDTSDGMGTNSKVELVFGNNDTHLIYCDGMYEGPLFRKPMRGKCVLLLKTGYVQTEEERTHITSRLDVFVQVDNLAIDAITKTLHPLLGKSADTNFIESFRFLERISRTAETNGPGVERLAGRLEVQEPIKDEFSRIANNVFDLAQDRIARRSANGERIGATEISTITQNR